jgi:hypothetical protein
MAVRHQERHRVLLAQEAARIMAEEGVRDFRLAKRKAAERLGLPANGTLMPRNTEIEAALIAHQRLFDGAGHTRRLRLLREAALEALAFFAQFRPRLVGSVLSGTAGRHSAVDLHLFAATTEDVVLFLIDQDIPFETSERRLRMGTEEYQWFPVHQFSAGDVAMDLVVFPETFERRVPWSPVDGKPMRRAGPAELRAVLEADSDTAREMPDA